MVKMYRSHSQQST